MLSNVAFSTLAAVAAVSFAQPARAALVLYDSRASFEAALGGGVTVENFNGVVGEPGFQTSPLTVGAVTLAGFGPNQFDRNFIDQPPHQFTQFDIDGTTNVNAVVSPGGSGFTISFASPVTGFGADFASFQDNIVRSRIVVGNDSFIPDIAGDFAVRFVGFTSDTPFTSILFEAANSTDGDGFSIDNAAFSNAVVGAVPEPSAWAMMLIGFAGIGAAARRRRRPVPVLAG